MPPIESIVAPLEAKLKLAVGGQHPITFGTILIRASVHNSRSGSRSLTGSFDVQKRTPLTICNQCCEWCLSDVPQPIFLVRICYGIPSCIVNKAECGHSIAILLLQFLHMCSSVEIFFRGIFHIQCHACPV